MLLASKSWRCRRWPRADRPCAGRSLATVGEASTSGQTDSASAGTLITYYSSHYKVPLPDGHRFPMDKYGRVVEQLRGDASLHNKIDLRPAPLAELDDLLKVHDAAYIERFTTGKMTPEEMRNVGFPWSTDYVKRTFASTGGTVAATHAVLGGGRRMAANAAGGTHHAFRARGEGFCTFNDIAVAAAIALSRYQLDSILVIDLDVHQGNGTAALFEDEQRVVTFDMHGDGNYPWRSRMRNTHDVALPDGTGDEQYMAILEEWMPRLLKQYRPQLILFQAGVDPLAGDSFGRLGLSRAGLVRRNNLVYSTALSNDIPLVITMGGGYTKPMDASVDCHSDVYRTAAFRLHAHVTLSAATQAAAAAPVGGLQQQLQ